MLEPSCDGSGGGGTNSSGGGGTGSSGGGDTGEAAVEGSVWRAAEGKIQCYYKQVTEGCGDAGCVNPHCVSSGMLTALSSNDAAVKALQLFSSRAAICPRLLPPSTAPLPPITTTSQATAAVTVMATSPTTAVATTTATVGITTQTATATASASASASASAITASTASTRGVTFAGGTSKEEDMDMCSGDCVGSSSGSSGSDGRDSGNSSSSGSGDRAKSIGKSSDNAGVSSSRRPAASRASTSRIEQNCDGGLSHELLLINLDQCRAEQSYAKLRMLLWAVFSNEIALKRSFVRKPKVIQSVVASISAQQSVVSTSAQRGAASTFAPGNASTSTSKQFGDALISGQLGVTISTQIDNASTSASILPESVSTSTYPDHEFRVPCASQPIVMNTDLSIKSTEQISSKEQLRAAQSDLDKDIDSSAECEMSCDDSNKLQQSDMLEESKNISCSENPDTSLELMQVDDNKDNTGISQLSAIGLPDANSSLKSSIDISDNEECSLVDRTVSVCKNEEVFGILETEERLTNNYAIGYNVIKTPFPEPNIDYEDLHKAYKLLKTLPECEYASTLLNAQLRLLTDHLAIQIKASRTEFEKDLRIIDVLVILLENPSFVGDNDYTEALLEPLCEFLTLLGDKQQAMFVLYLAKTWSKDRLTAFLQAFHHLITIKLITTDSGIGGEYNSVHYEKTICGATKAMSLVVQASIVGGEVDLPLLRDMPAAAPVFSALLLSGAEASKNPFLPPQPQFDALAELLGIHPLDSRKPLIPFSEFYDEFLSERMEVDKDYAFYKSGGDKFSFLYHPYILTPATKALALYYDNRIRMLSERRLSVYQTISDGLPSTPYLRLRVRRDHVISDALVELEMVAMESPSELRKQLVVEFEGEQGIDEGGVSKEFFQLITDQLFCPDYGMFSVQSETGLLWFNPRSFESSAQFSLVGLVLGLAIYNNVILDLRLPPALYKKLCGKPATFHDLAQWDPTMHRGLQSLLQYEGNDMEDVFMQSFRVGYQDVFGDCLWHNLKKDGDDVMVGQHNKQEFVSLYSAWLLNGMVEAQFGPFLRGFLMVTGESPLTKLFRPEELELLLCGSQNYDFSELEKSADYDGGYNSSTAVVRWFWEVVNAMNRDDQKRLLQFTTGSDRAPVGGLAYLKLVIARHGPDTDRLPTAHTCFNVLLLPEYISKQKLEDRLTKAISYSQGFGML